MLFSTGTEAYPSNVWLPRIVVLLYYLGGGYLAFTYGNAFIGLTIFLLTTAGLCSYWRGVILRAGPRTTRQVPPQSIPKCLRLSACSLHEAFKEGTLSSVDVTLAYIRLIQAVNPYINAMVFECFEEALRSAKRADAVWEEWRSKGQFTGESEPSFVMGVPCTIKECMLCEGCPNTSGNPTRIGLVATRDSQVVSNFRRAGAVILGVTNTSELCMWYESSNYVYGMSCNPYDTRCIVGGSSGGEGAAAGASFACFGVGSDIGGSIRMPAFFNGVYGFKTTPHLISNEGQFPGAKASANHFMSTGPITRFAEDLFPLARIASRGGFPLSPEEFPPAVPFTLETSGPLTPWDYYYYRGGHPSSSMGKEGSISTTMTTTQRRQNAKKGVVEEKRERSRSSVRRRGQGGGRSTTKEESALDHLLHDQEEERKSVAQSPKRSSMHTARPEEVEEQAMIEHSHVTMAMWRERKEKLRNAFLIAAIREREKKRRDEEEEKAETHPRIPRSEQPFRLPTWHKEGEEEENGARGGGTNDASVSSLDTSTSFSSSSFPPTLRIFMLEDYGVRFIPVSNSQKLAVRLAGEGLACAMQKAGVPVEVIHINLRDPKQCTGGVIPGPFRYFPDSFSMWVHALSSDPTENTFVSTMAEGGCENVNWIAELGRWCLRRSRHTLPAILLCVLETLEKSVPKFLSFGKTGAVSLYAFQKEMEDLLGEHGVLLAPTFPTAAPHHHQPLWNPFQFQYTAIFNVLQLPAVACPIWVGEDMRSREVALTPEECRERGLPKDYHLPKGVQLVGKRNTDEMLLGFALALDEYCQGYKYPGWAHLEET